MTISSKLPRNIFFFHGDREQLCIYISSLWGTYRSAFKKFQYEIADRRVNTWQFYQACSLAHGMLQCNILTYWRKKNSDTFAGSMKLFQHLYSRPFSLHADSPEDEEYHHAIVLCCFYCSLFYVSENSFPLEPVLIHPRTYTPLHQHPPSYLKHEHAFHYDFWHDLKCDRNNVIRFWLMPVQT